MSDGTTLGEARGLELARRKRYLGAARLRDELVAAGVIRPAGSPPLPSVERPDASRTVFRLDDAGRRAAAKILATRHRRDELEEGK